MTGYTNIECFQFENKCLLKAYQFLQKAGKQRFEAVALFAGTINGNTALIREAILPLQKSYKLEMGLMYMVEGAELHKINMWLYKEELRLLAQIHTHPQEAYHSATDDEYPIMTTIGGLSIVIPFFAGGKMDPLDWAYYRLVEAGIWKELDQPQIHKLIKII